MSSSPHPTRMVEFTLLATLLGVSLPFAIEALVQDFAVARLIATTSFLLTSLNFFHGKAVTLENDDYNLALTDRPGLMLADYALNVLVVISFVFMAFFLDNPALLVAAILCNRGIDTILVLIVRSISIDAGVRRAQLVWLGFNIGAFPFWGIFLWLFHPVNDRSLDVAVAYLLYTAADLLLDYSINRTFYFSVAQSWGDIATFWNEVQGEWGDLYRRTIIIPALLNVLAPKGKRILDLGCGNGCIARHLSNAGATVVGVDKFPAMLSLAEEYDHPGITYMEADLMLHAGPMLEGNYDAVVACFTLQDCAGLDRPMQTIAQNLAPGGLAVVVLEDLAVFDPTLDSSGRLRQVETPGMRRRWLDPPRMSGNGRRQLITWEPSLVQTAKNQGGAGARKSIVTVTRHWSEAMYVLAARNAGLEQSQPQTALHIQGRIKPRELTSGLRQYARCPVLQMIQFRKRAELAGSVTGLTTKRGALQG
jgi:SAM-dependent methyltransferase